jgi:hypothetical protein
MPTLLKMNYVLPSIASPISSEDAMKIPQTKATETAAQIVRWTITALILFIIALPSIVSYNSAI